ncbi:MAG: outer membrane lipid asymmetry maintenance protein MlaD [Rhodospirillales bacterium]
MRRNLIETVLGAVVLAVAGLFVYFAYSATEMGRRPGYQVSAAFLKIGGLGAGSDVRVNGVKVGTVVDRRLDPVTYDAVVTMRIDNAIRLPDDTLAAIASEGPLGGKYVRLEPGRSQTPIAPGGTITMTSGYRSLEDQVGDIIFLATGRPGAAE